MFKCQKGTDIPKFMQSIGGENTKDSGDVCCGDCRHFDIVCRELVGRYDKPCKDFEWW